MQQATNEQQMKGLPVPVGLLASILQLLPLRERLTSCTLVCSTWAEVVAATPAHVGFESNTSISIKWGHVQDWLHGHAGQVTSIKLTHQRTTDKLHIRLPCSRLLQLEELDLAHFAVQWETDRQRSCAAGSSQPGAGLPSPGAIGPGAGSHADMLVSCQQLPSTSSSAADTEAGACLMPKLRKLRLCECDIHARELCQLPQLISLKAHACCEYESRDASPGLSTGQQAKVLWSSEDISALLTRQTTLQDLSLGVQFSLLALTSISRMQHLQHLQLYSPLWTRDDNNMHGDEFLAALPPSLTKVALHDVDVRPSPAVSAQLSRLTALRQLELEALGLDPEVLMYWTHLQHLELSALEPDPSALVQDAQHIEQAGVAEEAATQELLRALAQLTQLQHLQVTDLGLEHIAVPQHLSALTASPQLTSLAVCMEDACCSALPAHGLLHVLPHGKQLTQLRSLHLGGFGYAPDEQCLDSEDIQRMAEACPGLTELSLTSIVSEDANLEPLVEHLQHTLQSLSVSGSAFDDTAAAVVAQLQHLQRLEWANAHELYHDGLLQLAQLTNLRRFHLWNCREFGSIMPSRDKGTYMEPELVLETAEGDEPDVCSKLRELCLQALGGDIVLQYEEGWH